MLDTPLDDGENATGTAKLVFGTKNSPNCGKERKYFQGRPAAGDGTLEHDADTPLYRLSETQMAAIGYLKLRNFQRQNGGVCRWLCECCCLIHWEGDQTVIVDQVWVRVSPV